MLLGMALPDTITIGELASRSGVSTSALRFYEAEGLIRAGRSDGGQRRFERSMLRRVAFIVAAQRVGLSLVEIRDALASLPDDRTPDRADWARLSRRWQHRLDERIADLERLRDDLSKCIGCGCLSLSRCSLYNRDDRIAQNGPGAQYLVGTPRIAQPIRRRPSP
jgi:MerR family redox-sensitive transcriptional activator SoxR